MTIEMFLFLKDENAIKMKLKNYVYNEIFKIWCLTSEDLNNIFVYNRNIEKLNIRKNNKIVVSFEDGELKKYVEIKNDK